MNPVARAQQSFESFYSKRCPELRKAITAWTGDRELGKDITQEVMMILLHYWGKHDRPEVFMYTLARQQLGRPRLKRHRGQDSLDERFERVEQMLERSGGQSAASASDAHIDMLRLVSSLPNRQRDAIVLTVVSDLTDADAAQIMGISATSVKTHRRRGVESLRKASLTSMGLNSDQS